MSWFLLLWITRLLFNTFWVNAEITSCLYSACYIFLKIFSLWLSLKNPLLSISPRSKPLKTFFFFLLQEVLTKDDVKFRWGKFYHYSITESLKPGSFLFHWVFLLYFPSYDIVYCLQGQCKGICLSQIAFLAPDQEFIPKIITPRRQIQAAPGDERQFLPSCLLSIWIISSWKTVYIFNFVLEDLKKEITCTIDLVSKWTKSL